MLTTNDELVRGYNLAIEVGVPVGMQLFSKIASTFFRTPTHGLELLYNETHGEYSAMISPNIGIMYLSSNTSNSRWACQYIATVGYGNNPWTAYERMLELLDERYSTAMQELVDIVMNEGCGEWTKFKYPMHIRENQTDYSVC